MPLHGWLAPTPRQCYVYVLVCVCVFVFESLCTSASMVTHLLSFLHCVWALLTRLDKDVDTGSSGIYSHACAFSSLPLSCLCHMTLGSQRKRWKQYSGMVKIEHNFRLVDVREWTNGIFFILIVVSSFMVDVQWLPRRVSCRKWSARGYWVCRLSLIGCHSSGVVVSKTNKRLTANP